MFNKPRGCITACSDARQKTVMDYIPNSEREGLFPIGRLDKDTEGFLILTDDGAFSFNVSNPKSFVEKTYFFWAKGTLDDEKIRRLNEGVLIQSKKGILSAPARAEKIEEATLRDISHLLPDEDPVRLNLTKRGDVKVTAVKITITEGKKHQVKRMAKAVGMTVVYLERIAIAGVILDRTLVRGAFRSLTDEEIEKISKKAYVRLGSKYEKN